MAGKPGSYVCGVGTGWDLPGRPPGLVWTESTLACDLEWDSPNGSGTHPAYAIGLGMERGSEKPAKGTAGILACGVQEPWSEVEAGGDRGEK